MKTSPKQPKQERHDKWSAEVAHEDQLCQQIAELDRQLAAIIDPDNGERSRALAAFAQRKKRFARNATPQTSGFVTYAT
jgi:hypothetical protein